MLTLRGVRRYIFIIPVLILVIIFICAFNLINSNGNSSVNYNEHMNNIPISFKTQRDISKLCVTNHLSNELVLAVYHIDGNDINIDGIKAYVEKLADHRDYWTSQGYPDEDVFNLMLLSHQRGIEGCKLFIIDNHSYSLDNYVQKVTQYKYYLEQVPDTL